VLFQRWLRNSLLSRAPVSPGRSIRAGVIADCALGLRMTVDVGSINLAPGIPMQFTGIHGLVLEAREPVEKAVLTVLASVFPERLTFPRLGAMLNQSLAEAGLPCAQDYSALHAFLHRLFALDALDVMLCGDGGWLGKNAKPSLSPLMRHQAEHDLPLTNRWHEPVALTHEGKRSLLDPSARPDATALERAGLLA